jgi:hypothetical protein
MLLLVQQFDIFFFVQVHVLHLDVLVLETGSPFWKDVDVMTLAWPINCQLGRVGAKES